MNSTIMMAKTKLFTHNRRRGIFSIILAVSVLIVPFSEGMGADKKKPKPIPFHKIVPGLDQLISKKPLKGLVLFSAFTVSIIGIISNNHNGNENYRKYLASTDPVEIVELREASESSFKRRNGFIIGACAVTLLHLLDLKLFGKKGGVKGEVKDSSVRLGVYMHF